MHYGIESCAMWHHEHSILSSEGELAEESCYQAAVSVRNYELSCIQTVPRWPYEPFSAEAGEIVAKA